MQCHKLGSFYSRRDLVTTLLQPLRHADDERVDSFSANKLHIMDHVSTCLVNQISFLPRQPTRR
uniref:Uncharacterized protein n=1 Tax=Arion vulgaris TaxID=1028688 RepID=A0A0B6YZ04_9EUPU